MCNMEKFLFIGLLFLIQKASAENVIYRLSKEDYNRMPPKNHLDRFERCLDQPGGVYCTAHADIVSDEPSELLDMMKGFSAHNVKHLNHTQITYGLCLTQTCQPYYNGNDDEAELATVSEACLNHSLSAGYGLKTRVTKLNCYFENKNNFEKDWLDWAFAALAVAILAINAFGTVYDINRDRTKPGNRVLMAFSLRANWNQMTAPASTDPKSVRLKPINGIRLITSLIVILGHTMLPLLNAIDNTQWIENAYDHTAFHFVAHGHLIILTFFLISGFLLTYNNQILSEKTKLTWKSLPRNILNRWLRLTPINILSLLVAATWIRFSSGPLWQEIIGDEVHDCRNYWLYNFFYINNFIDHSQCILQSWYLACDMQLHIIGMVVIVLSPSPKVRWWTLGSLYALGLLWTAFDIYTLDLHANLLASPTIMAEFFYKDPTFNYVYKRTYANMPAFIIGMVFGYIVYDWNKRGVFEKDLTKYRFVYWLLFPLMLTLTASAGFLFCGDAPRASMALRLIFGPIVKPLFTFLVLLIILGAMFKIDNLQRSILEWDGWVPVSRISYCIYAFHVAVLRYLGGTRTTLMHFSLAHVTHDYAGIVILTLNVALFFYLFVEAPFNHLNKMLLSPTSSKRTVNSATVDGVGADGSVAKASSVSGVKSNGAANGTADCFTALNGSTPNGSSLNGSALNGSARNENANGSASMYQETTGVKNKDA